MKTLIFLFAISMLILGSCTKTEYEEIIKYVDRPAPALAPTFITVTDTVVVRDTVSTTVVIRDTVVNNVHTTDTVVQVVTRDIVTIREVEKIVYHTDTVTQVVHDTVINNIHHYDTITKNVIVHDTVTLTVYDRTVIYHDTIAVADADHPTSWVPSELTPFMSEFQDEAFKRNKVVNGMPIIVQYVHPEDLPGEQWTSFSYHFGNQYVIQVTESLPTEQQKGGMFRELARLELVPRKKYSADVNKIMCPLFDPARTITTTDLNVLFQ